MKTKYLYRTLMLAMSIGMLFALAACGSNGGNAESSVELTFEEAMIQRAQERGEVYAVVLTELIAGDSSAFIALADSNRWATTTATMLAGYPEQVTGASLTDGVFYVNVLMADLHVYANTAGIWGMYHPASMITGNMAIEIMNMFSLAGMDDYWDAITLNFEGVGTITIPKYLGL